MTLDEWASMWNIPAPAIANLKASMAMDGHIATAHPKKPGEPASESRVQSLVRLEAAKKGVTLYRNNVGALLDARGIPVRYGLANESKAMNEDIKSSDLIGIRPVLITPQHVGRTIGQFVARECKEGDWVYDGRKVGTDKQRREYAQKVFLDFVLSQGGDAAFAPGEGTL